MRMKRRHKEEPELDITSFMNLMIILVPVLLMSMVLSRTTVLDLKLPSQAAAGGSDEPVQNLEVIIRAQGFSVSFAEQALGELAKTEQGYDFAALSQLLQNAKIDLENKGVRKRDIYLLAERDIDYQTLVTTMDTVRSYETVVAASVVNAELFPEIALGDAPELAASTTAEAAP